MSFAVGALVRARGREWVVLPESKDDLLLLRPLGGTDDETTGIYTPLEPVESATFDLPDPARVGDHRSCALLRDAVRLSSRASAGPFRSFGRIAVEPRPYQLVPLLMALKLDPVRLLIADDVGIGKTVEAALIAREMLDRGEVERLAVLCPPHLAEQWQRELEDKFHIAAELVLPGTAARLERGLRLGQSLFDVHPFVIVSTEFIKSDRRRDEFVRTCPELVIVDEAHACAFGAAGRGGRHYRHELLKALSAGQDRHLVLVTATPHSGKEDAFRSLLTFLDVDFARLPEDLSGPQNERHRRRVAAHMVQRRRGDIRHFLKADTPFPVRDQDEEVTYKLSDPYRALFERVLAYARETVAGSDPGTHRQRVRWWSILALLRSLASSPAAAASTLRNRAAVAETETADQADEIGRRTVFDVDASDESDVVDVAPGADATAEPEEEGGPERRRLLEMARMAEKLLGKDDAKLQGAVKQLERLVREGFRPIVFCRFIPTAEYVARELRDRLPKGIEVQAVTGSLPPPDREARILELAKAEKRVLVATDCLSEGINLQEHFDAVLHYDLSWSPTRHEQREGRVDRFGQPRDRVRVLTYYGSDNGIDGIVLDVLLRKHKTIRSSLGISVPVPIDTNSVVGAILEGLVLRGKDEKQGPAQDVLPGFEDIVRPEREVLHRVWDAAAEREKRSRTMFSQESIKPEEVSRELDEAREAVGSAAVVGRFTLDALRAHGAIVTERKRHHDLDLREVPTALKDALAAGEKIAARFELPVGDGVTYLGRTHPFVEALAAHVLDTSLDPQVAGVAARTGAISTRGVSRRTTLLLIRFRFDLVTERGEEERAQLAEECRLLAFEGAPEEATFLEEDAAKRLLDLAPDRNVAADRASHFASLVVDGFAHLRPRIEEEASKRAVALAEAHRRVRSAARLTGVRHRVEPRLPADVLGIYVFLPSGAGA